MRNAARVIVIEQPNYVPWIGTFDLFDRADVCVFYDCVQYTKRDWRNRNRLNVSGATRWITVPVKTSGLYHQRIRDVTIDYEREWVGQHLNTFHHSLGRAPFYEPVRALYAAALERRTPLLADLSIELSTEIARYLGLRTTFVRSSTLPGVAGRKNERLLSVCDQFDCGVYLSGPAARSYLDARMFAERGYRVRYIVYDYGTYDREGTPSVPVLSILDVLCHLGPAGTLEFMRQRRRYEDG